MGNRIAIFCALVLLLIAPALAQKPVPGLIIGKKPPLPKTAPFQGMPLNKFEPGVSYVLEFWGTWCGSCRVAIPHLNQLVQEMRGKKVAFYSIAVNDSLADLKTFLTKNKLDTNIVIDTQGETAEAYNAHVLPTTVLIGPDGNVAAFTRPEHVTVEALNKLMAGQALKLPLAGQKMADFDWQRKLPTTATSYTWIEESDTASGGVRIVPGSGQISGDGMSAFSIVTVAYDVNYFFVDWRAKDLDNLQYRIAVKSPVKDNGMAREMLRPFIKPLFQIETRWEEQEKEVYVIRADPAKTLRLKPPVKDGSGAGGGRIDWPSITSAEMVGLFTSFCFGKITVDETGLGDRKFSLKLKWIPGDRASATAAIEALGFQVTKEKRKVRMLVVENTK